MRRGRGRGRGTGFPSSFRDETRKDTQQREPISLFPTIRIPPPPEEFSERDAYLIQKNAFFSHVFKTSPFFFRPGKKRKDIERYTDQFDASTDLLSEILKRNIKADVYPPDLTGKPKSAVQNVEQKKGKRKATTKKRSTKETKLHLEDSASKMQIDLSTLEKEEEKDEKKGENLEEEDETKEKEEQEEELPGEEEELEWDDDYTMNYDFERDIEEEDAGSGEDEPAF